MIMIAKGNGPGYRDRPRPSYLQIHCHLLYAPHSLIIRSIPVSPEDIVHTYFTHLIFIFINSSASYLLRFPEIPSIPPATSWVEIQMPSCALSNPSRKIPLYIPTNLPIMWLPRSWMACVTPTTYLWNHPIFISISCVTNGCLWYLFSKITCTPGRRDKYRIHSSPYSQLKRRGCGSISCTLRNGGPRIRSRTLPNCRTSKFSGS